MFQQTRACRTSISDFTFVYQAYYALQAKSNESKYTGVSSDDLRGFGSKSSGLGSASSWTPTAGTSSKYKSTGLGATGFGSSSRGSLYDDYDEPVRTSEKVCRDVIRIWQAPTCAELMPCNTCDLNFSKHCRTLCIC